MSRLWKNELRLSLRTHGCDAELRRGGWGRRVVASASASGRGAAAITAAIAALRMADKEVLATADVRLVIADEYVDFALLGAEVSGPASRREALEYFSEALGHEELIVQTTPLPGARGWLAAAIDQNDYDAWMHALAEAGVQLRHVHPALVEDLNTLADRVKEDDAVLVFLREEGASLLRLSDGVPCAVTWERFDPTNHIALDSRLRAFARQTGSQPGESTTLYMLPQSQALCRFVWDGRDTPVAPATQDTTDREAEDLARALQALRLRSAAGAKPMPPRSQPRSPSTSSAIGRQGASA